MAISQKREFTRGAIAKESGVNLETIRFYEKIGLMPDPPRSRGTASIRMITSKG